MNQYPEIIRGLREDRDLKQSDIAEILGTSQQYYSQYETGVHEMSIRALILLANYYGVSTDYLLGRTKSVEGLNGLNKKLLKGYTAGSVLSDLFSLDVAARASIIEHINLHKINIKYKASLKKNDTE